MSCITECVCVCSEQWIQCRILANIKLARISCRFFSINWQKKGLANEVTDLTNVHEFEKVDFVFAYFDERL